MHDEPASAPDGWPCAATLKSWIFGEPDDLTVIPCEDQTTVTPNDDPDADIVVADLQATLAARDAEIAALRSQVVRPGYDPSTGVRRRTLQSSAHLPGTHT